MTHEVLQAARQIGPEIAARADEIEQARGLPLDLVDRIRDTGAFRMFVPGDLGGPNVDAWESLQVLEELAYHDGAAGWCSMISSTTSLLASFLPDRFAKEIYGNPSTITGGFAQPTGTAVPVDGGLRVSGRWAWGSGTRHCNWIGGGCRIVNESGEPTPRDDGLAAPFVFFAANDVSFIDNWHVSGMAGTGSGDYEVTDVFVPEGRWVQLGRTAPVRENSLSRFSFFGLLACGVASCSIGLGRRSIDELITMAATKTPQSSRRTLAERPQIQSDVAAAEAKLAAAWALMQQTVADSWASAQAGVDPTTEQKRQLRLSATHATQTAAEVTESMYKAGGGAAVYKTSQLQRTFRDAYVTTQHAMVAPRTLEMVGRLRLGLDGNTAAL